MLRVIIAVACLSMAGWSTGSRFHSDWKEVYLQSMDIRLHKIDKKMARVARDTSDRYRPDSLIYRSAFSEYRARRKGLDAMRIELIASPNEPLPADWNLLNERIVISLDGLERLRFTTDSTLDIRARRRYGLDPRLESIRSGTDREWRMDRREVERSRHGGKG